jgi:hypothetical protein
VYCCAAATKLAEGIPVTVVAGQTTTANIDLTPTAGVVTGQITVNGQPFRTNLRLQGVSAYSQTDSSGVFQWLLAPGNYTAEARDPNTSFLFGTFSFSIIAGQTTNIGQVTQPYTFANTKPNSLPDTNAYANPDADTCSYADALTNACRAAAGPHSELVWYHLLSRKPGCGTVGHHQCHHQESRSGQCL